MDLDHPNICCCLIDSPTRQPGGHFFSSAGEPMDLAHVATPIYPIIQVVDDDLVLKPMVTTGKKWLEKPAYICSIDLYHPRMRSGTFQKTCWGTLWGWQIPALASSLWELHSRLRHIWSCFLSRWNLVHGTWWLLDPCTKCRWRWLLGQGDKCLHNAVYDEGHCGSDHKTASWTSIVWVVTEKSLACNKTNWYILLVSTNL